MFVVRFPKWGGVRFEGTYRVVPGKWGVTEDLIRKGLEAMLRKADVKKAELMSTANLLAGDYGVLYPTLWAYLTQDKWDDGSVRKTASLTMFVDGGVLKAVLKDRESGLNLWAAGTSFEGLLVTMEGLLLDPTAVWRQDRQETGTTKRVKPRGG